MNTTPDNEIYKIATSVIERSLALQQIFRALPEGTHMHVTVADRVDFDIFLNNSQVATSPGHDSEADVLYTIDADVFRRADTLDLSELAVFFAEFSREMLSGRIRIKPLKPLSHFMSQTYLSTIKQLAPSLQAEAVQKAMMGLMQLSVTFDAIKQRFKK